MKLVEQDRCTGCSACVSVCPCHAIEMKPDSEGFRQPFVSAEKCVNCGRCLSVCPVTNPLPLPSILHCYAFRTSDRDLLLASTSGGAFSELARPILNEGGCVFGCKLERKGLRAIHAIAEDEMALGELRGSKYVQSDMGNALRECKGQLQAGRSVLFSGTPCQIAGLKTFLGKDYANLLCVEVICHGVASSELLKKAVGEVEERQNATVTNIVFRNKDSEKRFSLRFSLKNRSEKRLPDVYYRDYFAAFANNLSLRKSCYACPFKDGRSGADFTIADFWQVEKCGKGLEYGDGMSLVVVHTQKGVSVLDNLMQTESTRPFLCEVSAEDAFRGNPNYSRPSSRPPKNKRDRFMREFKNQPIGHLVNRLTHTPLIVRVLNRLKRELLNGRSLVKK